MSGPMPVLRQFFGNFWAADMEAVETSNKAYRGFDTAVCFLADFTLENQGLTPEQAQTLFEKLETYYVLNGIAAEAEGKKDELVFRMAATLGLPFSETTQGVKR